MSEEALRRFSPKENPQRERSKKRYKKNGFIAGMFGLAPFKMFAIFTCMLVAGIGLGSCIANRYPDTVHAKVTSISVSYDEKNVDKIPDKKDTSEQSYQPAAYKANNYTFTVVANNNCTYTIPLSRVRLQKVDDKYDFSVVVSDHELALRFNYDFEGFQKKVTKDNFSNLSDGQVFYVLQYLKDLEIKNG